jgi:hypothetical protein
MGVGHRSLTWPTYNVVVRFDSSGTGHAP